MKKIFFAVLVSGILIQSCKTSNNSKSAATPIIETIGAKPVYASEFNYIYNKNNGTAKDAFSRQSIKEYLDLYTNFKLKVREAEEMGLDTTQAFKSELEGYKKQLGQPYLTEKGVTEQLTKEAYERMKEEVSASHILITVGPEADAADTLAAYNKIADIRKRAVAGEDFEKLAMEFSQDPSAKTNKGALGYFTSLQMVYPFEEAAYKTPKGQISNIVRTKFGYHILKVNDKRKSQGQVRVAHIMIRNSSEMTAADSIANKEKIDEIYARLQKGEVWDNLTNQFSEDANTKAKGGELPWFSTGKMIPSFEDEAFRLAKPGDYSKPVQTPYGWHILKLLEKKGLEPFEELEPTLKTKVSKDSRSELNKTVLLQRLKKENKFVENPPAFTSALTYADSSLIKGTWTKKAEGTKNLSLFTINSKPYKTNDFFEYLSTKSKGKTNNSPTQIMKAQYKNYVNDQLLAYEESHLEEKYVDYKMLVKEYREGILLFQLMDQKVWSKAIEDTTGLQNFFKQNTGKYQWNTRAHASIFNVPNEETLEKVKTELKKDKFPVKNTKVDDIMFESGKAVIPATANASLDKLVSIINSDKNLVLEISGGADSKEATGKNSQISKKRVESVVAYLKSKGIDSTKIQIKDLGKAVARKSDKDRMADRKVSLTAYSKSYKTLESSFNENAPLTLKVTEGVFQKGENDILDQVEWKQGTQTIKKDGRVYYTIISSIDAPRAKTFEEARGLAISDYQTYLEQEWIKNLKAKYPVVVNEPEVQKLIKQ